MKVIAEGVEQDEQLSRLKSLGCLGLDKAQQAPLRAVRPDVKITK